MWAAMATLGVLALVGGVLQIPGVTHAIESFLEPTFEGSPFAHAVPEAGSAWLGLLVGAAMAAAGIGAAYYMYVVSPGTTARLQGRLRALHTLLVNKWYFDELYDTVIYRPTIAVGRFASSTVERVVVQGLVSGTVDLVRGAGSLVRIAQSGFIRAYALLLVAGSAGLALYFLIVSS
jgi:NADH-quinone oxidoreductase subunit L